MGRRRELPARTCVGCRERAPKGELVRVARSPAGPVALDPTGSAAGRGAYVHPVAGCVEEAFRRGAFARALRTGLSPEEAARLRADIEGMVR